jgi:DNA-binding response OmpR family regulator
MTCPDCSRRGEEIELLSFELSAARRELERLRPFAEVEILRSVLCLSLMQAKMMARLFRKAGDAYVPTYDLEDDQGADWPHENAVKVYVNRLRHALGEDIIEMARGEGYRLTPSGRALVAHVLKGGHPADVP